MWLILPNKQQTPVRLNDQVLAHQLGQVLDLHVKAVPALDGLELRHAVLAGGHHHFRAGRDDLVLFRLPGLDAELLVVQGHQAAAAAAAPVLLPRRRHLPVIGDDLPDYLPRLIEHAAVSSQLARVMVGDRFRYRSFLEAYPVPPSCSGVSPRRCSTP